MTHAVHGQHTVGRGDLTGARIQALSGLKTDHDAALATTRAALVSDPVQIIAIPGGRSYLAPAELVRHLIQVGVQSD
jgi:hypothetical protein